MPVLAILVAVLDILISIALVLLVLFQQGRSQGLGAIAGGAETFFGKQKGRSIDALLKRLTSVGAIVFLLLTVLLYLMLSR